MTGRPLDAELEAAMSDCEGIQFTLRSTPWNRLRDLIRARTIEPAEAKAYIYQRHGGDADACQACSCRRKIAAIAEGA